MPASAGRPPSAATLPVDELVRDQVPDDEHAPAAEGVDEPEQTFLPLGLTR
jgi:hypothetical protein